MSENPYESPQADQPRRKWFRMRLLPEPKNIFRTLLLLAVMDWLMVLHNWLSGRRPYALLLSAAFLTIILSLRWIVPNRAQNSPRKNP